MGLPRGKVHKILLHAQESEGFEDMIPDVRVRMFQRVGCSVNF